MRHITRRIGFLFCLTLSLAVLSNLAHGQAETVLYNFTYDNNGIYGQSPSAGITFDQQGRVYGTAAGSDENHGVVYRLAREGQGWIYSLLYSFGYHFGQDGKTPAAGVVFGPSGLLYGTTVLGGGTGNGTVFSLRPPATPCHAIQCTWLETILYSFTGGTDGERPGSGNLVFDSAGNIYGTTTYGGSFGKGVVFKLTRSGSGWTQSVLWNFTGGSDGANPVSGVIFDSAGNLYGTTPGAVYELSPMQSGWIETTLYSFTDPSTGPGSGGLIWDGHGNLFGITGGARTNSVAYELTPQNGGWSFSVLYNFGMQSSGPFAAPTFDSQGNLYGSLPSDPDNGGEIFMLTHSGDQWIYSPYYHFASCGGAAWPSGAVTFDANGNMFGTTVHGGTGCAGTVWEITP
jgi:uncharacterized repeat protein (TIGR03803 family)